MRLRMDLRKNSEESGFSAHLLVDHQYGLYVQDFFNERIYLERKRAERSRKGFALMLLKVGDLMRPMRESRAVHAIASVLFSITREIDLKGWYRYGASIGVLFSDIDPQKKQEFRDSMLNKAVLQFGRILEPDQLKRMEISFHFFPEEQGRPRDTFRFDRTLYPDVSSPPSGRVARLVKRLIDISVSLAALIPLAPLMFMIALAIRLSSEGPALFRQQRVGLFGRRFTFLKFRSMYSNLDSTIHRDYIKKLISGQLDKDSQQDSVYKITRDPRVTPVGRLLRKTSLDELPQFINVLRGDMSLVGPRPPIPYEFMDYDVWHRARVLNVKPGITGLWQIMGRSSTSFNDMVRLDLRYVREWTLWLDFKILLKTPWVVLACKGAY